MNVKAILEETDATFKQGYEAGFTAGEKSAKERALKEFEKILIKIKTNTEAA